MNEIRTGLMFGVSECDQTVLHWNEQTRQWGRLSWQSWSAFRRCDTPSCFADYLDYDFERLPGVGVGWQHFLVVINDDDGHPTNIIPHRYRLADDGSIAEYTDVLTAEEKALREKHFLSRTALPAEVEQELNCINKKERAADFPPASALVVLSRDLPSMKFATGNAARFMSEELPRIASN